MAILNVQTSVTGLSGTVPSFIYLETNDTVSAVQATGYLNNLKNEGYAVGPTQLALVQTSDAGVTILRVAVSEGNTNLVPITGSGGASLPSIANHIAVFTNTTGSFSQDAATAINNGNIQAGLNGSAGEFISYPGTANTGSLVLSANPNSGNYETVITNVAMGQSSTIGLIDPGVATSYFILTDSGSGQAIRTGGLTINNGHLTLGDNVLNSGASLVLYSNGVNYGTVTLLCTGNASNTATSYDLGSFGQSTLISVPDPANSFAHLLVTPGVTPFTSGNLLEASGTDGVVVDSGIAASSIKPTIYGYQNNNGDSGAIITYNILTLSNITTSSILFISVLSVTNANVYPVQIMPGILYDGTNYVPTQGEVTIQWSAAPGVHNFAYQAIIAP